MSLSTVLDGEHRADDGDCDEPGGDRPDERVARSGGWQDQDRRGIDVDGTWAASGVSAGEGVRQAWTAGAGVTTAWQAEQPGKPVAFYSDKHGVFRVNKKDAVGGDGMTQFGRALHALNIDIICANSSQAKGRVERANGTLQDRLVKEMRLCGIDTIAAGNAFLPAFMDDYNARFADAPPSREADINP